MGTDTDGYSTCGLACTHALLPPLLLPELQPAANQTKQKEKNIRKKIVLFVVKFVDIYDSQNTVQNRSINSSNDLYFMIVYETGDLKEITLNIDQ